MEKRKKLRKIKSKTRNTMEKENYREWKEENRKYLKELQLFFDRVEEIKDISLKQKIINQMLQCDKALTEIAEDMFLEYYQKGYKEAKGE